MQVTKQPAKNKYITTGPIACFRSGIVDDNSYGVLVLIPGHKDHYFGYYLAGERQIGDKWVYQVYNFTRKVDDTTYIELLKSIMKVSELK